MRILYSFPHRIGAPGIGTIAQHQVLGLVERGHNVTVYCMSLAEPLPGVTRVVTTGQIGGHRVPRRLIGFDRALSVHDWFTARDLRQRRDDFDAVHCWGLGSVRTLGVAREVGVHSFREACNTHTAFSYTEASAEAAKLGVRLPRGHSHIPRRRRLALEQREFQLAHTILVPSDYARQTFLDEGLPASQLARHQYGFDPRRFPAPDAKSAQALAGSPLRACFVGWGEPRKGLHYALEAWRRSSAAATGEFVVCGRLLPDYHRAIASLLDAASVKVVGFRPDVDAVMRAADVLVLPSVEEGSALVTYEAQASGCVLLVSDAAGAMCTPDTALIHRARDVAALTEHLDRLDADRALLARLRSETISRRPLLTWSAAAARLNDIYEWLASARA